MSAAMGVSAVATLLGGLNAGLFIKPMGDDIGISRGLFGWAIAARQIAGALSAPWMGRFTDRFGARSLMIAGGLAASAAIFWMGRATHSWQVILALAVVGYSGINGSGSVLITTPVAKWFVHKRAAAMAVVSTGVPLGVVIFVPLTSFLIDKVGWRDALSWAAVIAFVLIVPMALLVRRSPEDMGLLPDGDFVRHDAAGHLIHTDHERSWTRDEAVKSRVLWRLIGVFGIVMLAQASIGTHRIAHFADEGIDEDLIAWGTGLDALSALFFTVIFGRLLARFDARYVGAVGLVLMAGGTVFTIYAHNPTTMLMSMVVFGGSIGALLTLQNYMWPEYFGRTHIGAIRGVALPFTLLMSAAGPVVSGYTYDAVGTYNPVWFAGAVVMLLGSVLLATTPKPSLPPSRASLREIDRKPS